MKTPGELLELELLSRITRGDTSAINDLLAQLNAKVRPGLLEKGLSNEDIDELLMDVIAIFLFKLKNQEYIYKGYPMIVYLIKVVKLRLHHYLRRLEKHQKVKQIEWMLFKEEEQAAEDLNNWERVLFAMNKLKEEEKKLIELYYLEGYKDKEIYEKKVLPYGSVDSVKSQRFKAIKKLMNSVHSKD